MRLVLTDGGVRVHPAQVAVADGERVGVDWLNFTVNEDVARRLRFSVSGHKLESDDGESTDLRRLLPVTDLDLIRFAHEIVCELVGVDLDLSILGRRHLGWAQTGQLGEAGLVAAGGNGDTIFVSLSGHGCLLAGTGGMRRIADFVDASPTAKITRIDLAFDDLGGELFPVRGIPALWSSGLFDSPSGGSRPKLEKRGDWERGDPNRRGLTAYVGSRQGGQLCRVYEKGRQLGDAESEWVRVEVELHSSCFCLLPQMLRTPTRFFVALKPIFERVVLADAESELERIARLGLADADKAISVLRKQYGAVMHALRNDWFGDDKEMLDAICREGRVSPALKRALEVREVALKRAGG